MAEEYEYTDGHSVEPNGVGDFQLRCKDGRVNPGFVPQMFRASFHGTCILCGTQVAPRYQGYGAYPFTERGVDPGLGEWERLEGGAKVYMQLPPRKEKPVTAWRIENDNDTGPGDEGFWEWWVVTNDKRSFKCNKAEDAAWLLSLLVAMCPDA